MRPAYRAWWKPQAPLYVAITCIYRLTKGSSTSSRSFAPFRRSCIACPSLGNGQIPLLKWQVGDLGVHGNNLNSRTSKETTKAWFLNSSNSDHNVTGVMVVYDNFLDDTGEIYVSYRVQVVIQSANIWVRCSLVEG